MDRETCMLIFVLPWIAWQVRAIWAFVCHAGQLERDTIFHAVEDLHIFLVGSYIVALEFLIASQIFDTFVIVQQTRFFSHELYVDIREVVPLLSQTFYRTECILITGFCVAVKALIDQEVKNGIPSNRIILGGFSQVRYGWKEPSFSWGTAQLS